MGLGTCLKPGEKLVPAPGSLHELEPRGILCRALKRGLGQMDVATQGSRKGKQKEDGQSPVNTGPFQCLVRAAMGNVGSGRQRLLKPPTPLVSSTDTRQFSTSSLR